MNNNFLERYTDYNFSGSLLDDMSYDDVYVDTKRYKCSCCEKECYGTYVDYGFDGYEYGSISGKHVDMAFVSDCCEANLEELE